MLRILCMLMASALLLPARPHHPHHRYTRYRVQATAFCQRGVTKAGTISHTGTVAADPAIFPLGTVLRVRGAGRFDATYIVADTGSKIDGRHIDIFMPSTVAARRFGKRMVWVQVVKWGSGDVSDRADHAVHRAAVGRIGAADRAH